MFHNIISRNDASAAAEVHRNAFNAAFYELGLPFHWDSATYQSVLCEEGERECLCAYLSAHQAHLLTAYDATFLVDAIQLAKTRCYEALTADGCSPAAYINWAELQQCQVGV